MTSKPVIYISSTFFDLQEHRAELILALQSTNVFDVRGMENYGTIDKPPLEQCLLDVSNAEFYILLLGNRYGFVPEGYQLSITNLEYKKAIGDEDLSSPAGKRTNTSRCVLPFIAGNKYNNQPQVIEMLEKEKENDGDALTRHKETQLDALKAEIKKNYVVNKDFTSPADLVAKVMGALLPELVRRKYGALVNNILLPEKIVYRCNRVKAREDFLLKNARLFRLFVIHGETDEMPEVFSNNISHFDLNIENKIQIKNLDEYSSTNSEKFLTALAVKFYFEIYNEFPKEDNYSFDMLAETLMGDANFSEMVISIEISYQSWSRHYDLIKVLFDHMNKIKPLLGNEKNLYLLFVVKYKKPEINLEESPENVAVLDKLRSLHIYDIEDWVGTYFYSSNDIVLQNRKELLTRQIIQYYFKEYDDNDEAFTMEEATKLLTNVLYDFNNNKNLFENYQNLYGNS